MQVPAPDAHILARCLRSGRDDDLRAELRGLDTASWQRLVDQAIWHGVAPLLYHRVGRGDDPGMPPEQLQRLRDLFHHCLLMNNAIFEQLSEVIAEITGAGFPVLALKGAYLAHCVYEDAALRPMADIDLLARPGDAEGIHRHLMTLGYRHAPGTEDVDYSRLHHLPSLVRPGVVNVEVHHDLAPKWAPFRSDITGLWHRRRRTRVGDLDLPHPAAEDLLLHLCTHAAHDDEFRLGLPAACDVDAVVRRLGDELNWARLVETANSDGRARFGYAMLRLTAVLLETPIPQDALAALHHGEADEEVVREAVGYVLGAPDRVPSAVQSMGDAATPRGKLKRLWGAVFPPPKKLRRIYHLGADSKRLPLYYVWRPVDLLLRRGRQLFGLLVRSPRSKPALDKERRRRVIRAWARGKAPGR